MKQLLPGSSRNLLILIVLAVAIRVFALVPARVESWYSQGAYRYISLAFRTAFGWLPFSLGDLLYAAAGVLGIWRITVFIKDFFSHRRGNFSWIIAFTRLLSLATIIYIVFSSFWGLNYYRQGIGAQLQLKSHAYGEKELKVLVPLLQQRLNAYAELVNPAIRNRLADRASLIEKAAAAYRRSAGLYPFLEYRQSSVKSSLYTPLAPYVGFTGYFNPFTSEAQINTEVPAFMRPFIINHEIAHQLGYAKENEASFVSFLTCRHSGDPDFLYALYFELYRSAGNELRRFDKPYMENMNSHLSPMVKADMREMQKYLERFQNIFEPIVSSFYDKFLKVNNQPEGMATYNRVIALVWAYVQKNGREAL